MAADDDDDDDDDTSDDVRTLLQLLLSTCNNVCVGHGAVGNCAVVTSREDAGGAAAGVQEAKKLLESSHENAT